MSPALTSSLSHTYPSPEGGPNDSMSSGFTNQRFDCDRSHRGDPFLSPRSPRNSLFAWSSHPNTILSPQRQKSPMTLRYVEIGRMPFGLAGEKSRGKRQNVPCIVASNVPSPKPTSRMRGHSVFHPCAPS